LAIELGPEPLPPAARQLVLRGANEEQAVVGSNLRSARRRIPVQPSAVDWTWACPALGDHVADEMAAMHVAGLPDDRATPFAVDSLDVGRRRQNTELSKRAWRIVVPPAIAPALQGHDLGHGWRLFEVDLRTGSTETAALLAACGLEQATSSIDLAVIGEPVAWQDGPSSEPLPVLRAGTAVEARVRGFSSLFTGDLTTSLVSTQAAHHLPMPAGGPWALRAEGLPTSTYALAVTPARTAVEPARTFFAVADAELTLPPTDVQLVVDGTPTVMGVDGTLLLRCDLQAQLSDEHEVIVRGPPLTPAWIELENGHTKVVMQAALDEDGVGDVGEWLSSWAPYWEKRDLLNVRLDFGPCGAVCLHHRRQRTLSSVVGSIRSHVAGGHEVLTRWRDDASLFDDRWLLPLLRVLGFEIEGLQVDAQASGLRAYRVDRVLERDGKLRRRPYAVVVVVRNVAELEALFIRTAHAEADRLCDEVSLDRSFITDGVVWSKHPLGGAVRDVKKWDLRELTKTKSDVDVGHFLNEFEVL
jgi:hypothetical protein